MQERTENCPKQEEPDFIVAARRGTLNSNLSATRNQIIRDAVEPQQKLAGPHLLEDPNFLGVL